MTTERKNVGIWGVGAYLPQEVRTNDWWPKSVVERWRENARRHAGSMPGGLSDGRRLAFEAMAETASDPFGGATERRVLPKEMLPSDAETIAAREAMEKAGIGSHQIGMILTSSFCPDAINVPNAFALHRNLGLPEACFTSGLDAGCNAFPLQLALAEQMIAGGQVEYALLVQSSVLSRLLPYEEPFSTYFGDGASAVVIGPVGKGRGVLGRSHFSDGRNCGALVAGVPGKAWYEDGRSYWYHGDKKTTFDMLVTIPEIGRLGLQAALDQAGGIKPEEIDFFACHQGTPWFRRVVQEHSGLTRARTLDTFAMAGSLIGANIGLILRAAENERMLHDDDLVAIFASGVGSSWSSLILRWGR